MAPERVQTKKETETRNASYDYMDMSSRLVMEIIEPISSLKDFQESYSHAKDWQPTP